VRQGQPGVDARCADVVVVASLQDGDPLGQGFVDQGERALIGGEVTESSVAIDHQADGALPDHAQLRIRVQVAGQRVVAVGRQPFGAVADHAAEVVLHE